MSMHCLQCGGPIQGRSDKKFCGSQCRANYHNHKNRKLYQQMRHINAVLRHNHKVLTIYGQASICRREDLVRAGFDFRYVTHLVPAPSGSTLYGCYTMAYEWIGQDRVRIFECEPPPIQLIIRKGGYMVLPPHSRWAEEDAAFNEP